MEIFDEVIGTDRNNYEIREKFREESDNDINSYLNKVKKENDIFRMKIENMKNKRISEKLKMKNQKLLKARDLICDYQKLIKEKDRKIEKLEREKKELNNFIHKIPKFIRIFFLKINK